MDRPLNIAHCVESYAPALGGMAEVVRQLSERMVRMGHRVTVLTSAHPARTSDTLNGVRIRSFHVRGNAVDGMTGEVDAYVRAVQEGGYDVVTLFAAQQWATDALLPQLTQLPGRKVFVPTGFSALRDQRWADYYGNMPTWLAQMDLNVFHSEGYQDVVFAKQHGIQDRVLIPNGAAEEEFEAPPTKDFRVLHGIAKERPLIMHLGSFTGIKGHREALRMFVRANTGNAVLALIGNGNKVLRDAFHGHWRFLGLRLLAWLRRKRILFLELDRSTTVDALRQADLFLFPSNVECSPIVLFEAMAAGVPFLASKAGNSAEIAEWTLGGWTIPGDTDERGLVHPNIATGAHLLEDLLTDRERAHAAGTAGQRAWKERFTWRHIAQQYLTAYQGLLR